MNKTYHSYQQNRKLILGSSLIELSMGLKYHRETIAYELAGYK